LEWQFALLLFFGSLVFLLALGMPVAFSFLLVNIVFMFLFWGGEAGLEQLVESLFVSVASFTLLPIPLFIIMGEVMFRSDVAPRMMDTLDKWLGRLPGRLGLLAVGGGTLFATLSGASMASTAVLGSVLAPEMERRGYKKPMSLGPILGSGGLAIMIPPSALAVLLGAIGEISIGRILIAIIVPGLVMAVLYAIYIIVRCWLQPSIAPAYETPPVSLSEKIIATATYVLPIGFIFFLVVGVIFMGVATPSEAAATGTLGVFILAFIQKSLDWEVVKKSVAGTLITTGMIFLIMAGAKAFSQILSFTGATRGLSEFAMGLPIAPHFIVVGMQIIILILGCFMNVDAIILLTIPIFMPIIDALGFDPVWFGTIALLNLELALITPPFGLCLFVMKGVAPSDTTMGDVYRAALPFIGLQWVAMVLIIAFPEIALWLPGLMR